MLLAELSGGPALDTRGVHTGSIVSGEQWQWACTLLEGGAGWRLEGGAGWSSLQVQPAGPAGPGLLQAAEEARRDPGSYISSVPPPVSSLRRRSESGRKRLNFLKVRRSLRCHRQPPVFVTPEHLSSATWLMNDNRKREDSFQPATWNKVMLLKGFLLFVSQGR